MRYLDGGTWGKRGAIEKQICALRERWGSRPGKRQELAR